MFEDTLERVGQFLQLAVVIAQQLPGDLLRSVGRTQHLIDNPGEWGERLRKTFATEPAISLTTHQPAVISVRPQEPATPLTSGMFIQTEGQLELVRQCNTELNWGFTNEDFIKLGEAPAWPEGKFSAVVLEVSLDTVERTFEEAWRLAVAAQDGRGWRWDEVRSDQEHLRLFSAGIQYQRGLRWRILDLAVNWDRRNGFRPMDVRKPGRSPHSAILWAASYFPEWVQAMDGIKVPYVWIPGYELSVSGGYSWSHVPGLYFNRDNRQVRLNADNCGNRNGNWAVPEFRE